MCVLTRRGIFGVGETSTPAWATPIKENGEVASIGIQLKSSGCRWCMWWKILEAICHPIDVPDIPLFLSFSSFLHSFSSWL